MRDMKEIKTRPSGEAVLSVIEQMVVRERYVNDGSPTGLTWLNSSSAATCPRRGPRHFALPLLRVSGTEVEVVGTPPSVFTGPGHHRFPVHPDCVQMLGPIMHRRLVMDDAPDYLVAMPTASPRTVFLSSSEMWAGFIKLDYPLVLGRYARELFGEKLTHSLAVSSRLQAHDTISNGVFHFPEFASMEIVAENGRRSGALFRSAVPTGETKPEMFCMCSLFARDYFDSTAEAIVVTLARRFGGVSWVTERVVEPLLASFWTMVTRHGIWPEAHAQNVVVGVDADGTTSVYWRDCQGMWFDAELGAEADRSYHVMRGGADAPARRSFLYDWMLGRYVLEPLLRASEPLAENVVETLTAHVRATTRRLAGAVLADGLVPKDIAFEFPLRPPEGERLTLQATSNVPYR